MKKWNIQSEYTPTKNLISLLLQNRGLATAEEQEKFLNTPSILDYFTVAPVELKQSLKDARNLITKAMANGENIVVHGDYDADGISSTAILYNTLKNELGYQNTFHFIPNRFDHGYGVSTKSVDAVVAQVNNDKKILFITVDSGITAVEETKYIKSLGHSIIITDHHQKPDVLPEADCIVWYDKVVGATLSWLLSRVLGSKNPQTVAMAALATVTDLQPVMELNRAIVKDGLRILNSNPPIGLKKLLEISGKKTEEVTTYDLGWVIGPRLNASGRLVDASQSLKLLIEQDADVVTDIAWNLHKINNDRQDKTLEMYGIASEFESGDLPKILISANTEYHEGIIGLVAAKLMQRFYRPAIVISLNDEHGKGSVRSVRGVNIIEYLRKFEDMFESLGGHPMAAGFTIKRDRIEELKAKVLAGAGDYITDDMLIPVLDIDMKIPLEVVSLDLLNEIDKLKPFGLGNEEPLFASLGVGVADISFVGKEGQHAIVKLYTDAGNVKAVYFNSAEDEVVKSLKFGDKIDVAYTLKKNEFNGKTSVDLFVKDLRKA